MTNTIITDRILVLSMCHRLIVFKRQYSQFAGYTLYTVAKRFYCAPPIVILTMWRACQNGILTSRSILLLLPSAFIFLFGELNNKFSRQTLNQPIFNTETFIFVLNFREIERLCVCFFGGFPSDAFHPFGHLIGLMKYRNRCDKTNHKTASIMSVLSWTI